jgi:hypothetical protein
MLINTIVQSKTKALLCLPLLFIGCSEQTKISRQPAPIETPKSSIVAIVHTQAIRQDELWPALIELGGDEILQEHLLTIELESALTQQGLTVLPSDLQVEENLLSTLTSDVSKASIDEILHNQGYGTMRKSKLLWRNAALRKLVQDKITLSDEAIQRMFSIVYGPKYPTQLIVVSTLEEANAVVERIHRGDHFSDVAFDVSIDPSASRGGHVNSISTADPIWPAPIREVVSKVEVGSVSNPIFIGDRWVVLTLYDSPTSSSVAFEEVEVEMRYLAKIVQERFFMENLAEALIQESDIRIIDRDLLRTSRSNANRSE